MAKIYKIAGYIVCPNDDEVDIEELISNYTEGYSFIRTNECEEFEWNDDLEINHTDDYWVADKLFCQLAYDRAVESFKN